MNVIETAGTAPSSPGDTIWSPRVGYTIEIVAQREGVSVATIRRWVREGRFPHPKKRGGAHGRCIWYGETLNALAAA